jgi:hypothetical protein
MSRRSTASQSVAPDLENRVSTSERFRPPKPKLLKEESEDGEIRDCGKRPIDHDFLKFHSCGVIAIPGQAAGL